MPLPFIIDPYFINPGLATGVSGILAASICLLALRKHRLAAARDHADLRSMVRGQEAEWSSRIEQLGHGMAALERRARSVGMPADGAAPTLGLGRREMRLIAEVSRTLALK